MLFTSKFTALAFAVVAATFCQITAKPAPVEASSNGKDALTDTIDANITRVGQPIDSAVPSPDIAYYLDFSTRTTFGDTRCSEDPSDLGTVPVPAEYSCTPIPVATGRNVLCLRSRGGPLGPPADARRVFTCTDDSCQRGQCTRLSQGVVRPNDFYRVYNLPTFIYIE